MSTAKNHEYREDLQGIRRLAAAPGDEAPAAKAAAPGPVSVEMGPQQWDDIAGKFSDAPGKDD